MSDGQIETGYREIVFHDDDKTPQSFVVELLHAVFGKQLADAYRFIGQIAEDGEASCGSYPGDAANELLETARRRVEESGHPLRITSKKVAGDTELLNRRCTFCGELFGENHFSLKGKTTVVCDDCLNEIREKLPDVASNKRFNFAYHALSTHFSGTAADELVSTSRTFPGHMRADVQVGVDRLFSEASLRFFGIYEEHRYETLNFAALTRGGRNAHAITPAQYHDVDIGDGAPAKCLENGLWLCEAGDLRYAVVLSADRDHGRKAGTRIEIAVPIGEEGAVFVQRCFAELERAVNDARCYRGKVLSLEGGGDYSGRSRGIMVHKLPPVRREEVILPEATLKLLDRNVLNFVDSREQLRQLGQSTRKGILLYGPPGTGKTHTIRYLATNLPGHTTLIITAAQVALLPEYMGLARLLQPAMVVIEDVDLIARDREKMGPCDELMLNELLNQMDGLKQDADILFVLTTNRPEQLEGALAGRPGRIDQAIEVPLPDDIGRGKLVQLYGKGLTLGDAVVREAAQRTQGVSAAFIKEMMRRVAQASIARDGGKTVVSGDISEALDDMLFTGGKLNVKLLGGAREMAGA
jgi:ATP-dependent Clp protease adapter protein ClpS